MNGITKLLIIIIVLVCAGLFIKGPGGKPYISLESLGWWSDKAGENAPTLKKITSKAKEVLPESITRKFSKTDENSDAVYKWKDENGVWHYSDSGNPEGQGEMMKKGPENDLIILPAKKFDEPTKQKASASKTASDGASTGASDGASARMSGGTIDGGTLSSIRAKNEQDQEEKPSNLKTSRNPVRQALNIKRKMEGNFKQLEEVEKP